MFLADLNDDGFNDTVSANYYGNNVSVLLNKGDGTFAEHVLYDVDTRPRSLFLADLDNNLGMDIITANIGDSDSVTILFNNGDGTFSGRKEYGVRDDPRALFVADVGEDANGDLDIMTANYWDDDVTVLLNHGDGTFATPVIYNAGNGAYGICAADFDGDGKNDIATANFLDDSISVLLNNGDGTFPSQDSYPGDDGPRSIYTSDVDGVNNADIIVANRLANNVSVFLNNGDGTFASHITYEVGLNPLSVHAKDIDGDNDVDIITANNQGNSVSILKNNGDGTFQPKMDRFVGAGPYSVFIADVGEDTSNDMEIITANNNMDNIAVLLTNHPPTFTIIEPDGIDDVANTNYTITWVDFDFDDNASISLYFYNETSGMWELIFTGIGEDNPQNSYEWNTTSLPEGEYPIKGVITDPYDSFTHYSVGNVTVLHSIPNVQPFISFIEPDGINDIANYNYTIRWEDADPDDNANISLYYDDDNISGSGIWIADLKEDDIDFYNWNTTLIPEGQWYIFAIIEDPWHTPVHNFSIGPLTIDHPLPLPPNLQDGNVAPISGFEGDYFNFTINYSHLQNKMPIKVTLNLTAPYQKTYEMLEVKVSDKYYGDGKIFYYNLSLSDGTYSYHFAAFDGVFWVETLEIPDCPIVARLPPNLSNGKVFPASGLEITLFNFTVNYSDHHNDPVVSITLNLTGPSGGNFPMMEADTSDNNNVDGKEYYFSSTLLAGIYSYHFAASNGIYWVETEEVLNSPIITAGGPALIESKVTPYWDFSGENFDYTVTYIDPNNDLPTEIWVNITGPSGGNFMLVEVDPSDSDCIDGKLYHFNLTLLMGVYSYHFAASDGTYWVETVEANNSPLVLNNFPSLDGNPVTPTTGFGGQYFNFSVMYTDADNEAPISIYVNITGPSGGNYNMMEAFPADRNFADGKLYYYNIILSAGTYSYHFSATDGIYWVETEEVLNSPIVTAGGPALIECKVTPYWDFSGENFDYTVTYIDPNNDLPTEIWVNITGPSGGNFMLVEVDPSDSDCIDGKLYHFNLTLLMGVYSYHFAASDGTYWVETEEVHNSPLVLNNFPSLDGNPVTPTTGFGGQYFNFSVMYTDADNEAPISIYVNITGPSGGNYNMMEAFPTDRNFADGKLYYYNIILSEGTYSYHFSATDGTYWVETSEMVNSLIVANNPPWITITSPPASGVTVDDKLIITWVDSDSDDNALISLYYDTDTLNHDGILILSNISEDDETNSYTWNILSIPNGTYYIYAIISDDTNLLVYNYSLGFVIVVHPSDDPSDEETQIASSADPSFNWIFVVIIIAIILSILLLALKRRRAPAPEERVLEMEPEEEPDVVVAEAGILLPPAIEGRLDKLEKELDKLLTEEVELEEEDQGQVKEGSVLEDMEEILFICPRCATILKQEMKNCPGCGFGFEMGEDV